jgi:anti-anti-sigma factor
MPAVKNTKALAPTFPAPNLDYSPLECGGVRLTTHWHSPATVVAASGEVDASNVDSLISYALARLDATRALVLDLSELGFLGAQGFAALAAIDDHCASAGLDWAVVPSHSVTRLLRVGDRDGRLPVAGSVVEALQGLGVPAGTRGLLQLVSKTG